MLVSVLRSDKRKLWHGAALLLVTGMAAGCSSQVTRFNGLDDIFTGSTTNQRQIIKNEGQPYPGGDGAYAAAPVDSVPTGSVSRQSLTPATSQPMTSESLARPQSPSNSSFPSAQPETRSSETRVAAAPARQPAAPTQGSNPAGWSSAGGTQVAVKSGDTVYSLSKRYGVPANVIAQVNGLPGDSSLQAGQKIVIPTYSNKAPGSTPDSAPKVASANTSAGSRQPSEKLPLPGQAPQGNLAVLPQQPKVRDGSGDANAAPSSDANPVKPAAVASAGAYTVQEGDTLTRIAKKTGVSVSALKAANGMQDGIVRVGQTLKVPSAGQTAVAQAAPKVDPVATSTVQPAKEAAKEAQVASYTPPKKDKIIEQAEISQEAAPNSTGIGRMRWPVRGKVISSYGKGQKDGIDIAVPPGTPVKAAENGVVIYAGDGLKEFGNTVLVRHENGLVTVYGHASELKVQRGQKVRRGDDIALSGMSGNANAPKLHFEVRKNSAPVDPSTFLE
ncbi:peptidoglycan DD-metalloendopeptidase family protein [Pseudaminobacter sp. 19-2017]|uniref:Peptidoglycan DD-metalloendopeptidase family protein n=1 Tax=Pseudaminobacter soli (ex Zhang et al. 2022) TaxID=2831468 RepID=A0A942E723_9HYPH|nr:peptidoglycan DD-metalloendopeptidase family protein [Pseudaminobacter soli]MBS3649632.1 peptidoglycan DD-metalloendopeptidase family protein [Pseudaminobacter soli]